MRRRTFVLTVAMLIGGAAAALAQGRLPEQIDHIVAVFLVRHPELAKGDDDQRRVLTRMIIEQVVHDLPGEGWGWKSAGVGRPPSKDCIAKVGETQEQEGHLVILRGVCFDYLNGATRQQIPGGLFNDIRGQVFLPVDPVNHLGHTPIAEPPPPAGDSNQLALLEGKLDSLDQALSQALAAIAELRLSLETRATAAAVEQVRLELADARGKAEQIIARQEEPPPMSRRNMIVAAIVAGLAGLAAAR